MKKKKRVILSFDVDGERAFGDFGKKDTDMYLDNGVPEIIGFLKKKNLDATFFTVGKNILDFPEIHGKLKDYEIGNHTFSHPGFLTKKSKDEKEEEIRKGHDTIVEFFGSEPKMFRAPDYQIDGDILELLKEMNYAGDSSVIRVLLPYRYFVNYLKQRKLSREKMEIPLTSFIIPFNGTSVISFGMIYAKIVFNILKKVSDTIVLNFHPRDFVNVEIGETGFMNRKKALETSVAFLEYITEKCEVVSFRQYLNGISGKGEN